MITTTYYCFSVDHTPAPYQLQLHFDINKTIIATDAVQGKGLDETINSILAENMIAYWDGEHEQSYYAYVTNKIAREHPQLSRASEAFKTLRSHALKEFPVFLKKFPNLLAQYEDDKARMKQLLEQKEIVIFPSFYKTIAWLEQHFPGKYVIYLRTFGEDLPEVISIIEQETALKFSGQGKFQGRTLSLATEELDLCTFFTNSMQHYAIQDDYAYWKSKGFQAIGGKPFLINRVNYKIIAVFFDDNANDPDKPIICPIGADNQLEDTQELLKSGNIVAVNPKEAILDEDYFINKIKKLCR